MPRSDSQSRFCRRVRPAAGFSLLEVVVAVGIFAIGMLAVVGLFSPVARSVSVSSDLESAARVADALRTKLQAMPVANVIALLKNNTETGHEITVGDARPDYNPVADTKILFANRDGSIIAGYSDAIWGPRTGTLNPDREKYYEIALIRNESLTPRTAAPAGGSTEPAADPDATAYLIAYTARIRWPMFARDGATGAVQVGANPTTGVRFDHSVKQVFFVTGAVTR